MKLLNSFKELILENAQQRRFVGRYNDGDKVIFLFSTYHQWKERYGSKSFEEILNIFWDSIVDDKEFRIGVPDVIIDKIFQENYQKIKNKFDEIIPDFEKKYPPILNPRTKKLEKSKRPRIHIVKNRRKTNEVEGHPEEFDFIEFVLQQNDENVYEIITSAFSDNGRYLKVFKSKDIPTPKLVVEKIIYFDGSLII